MLLVCQCVKHDREKDKLGKREKKYTYISIKGVDHIKGVVISYNYHNDKINVVIIVSNTISIDILSVP